MLQKQTQIQWKKRREMVLPEWRKKKLKKKLYKSVKLVSYFNLKNE